ncbi:MAG: fused MFS/spermidine synthase, partial [Chloroflexi bacterium]|nr:fused MFS/spermidine synthase [Chloroflexota bacterium]
MFTLILGVFFLSGASALMYEVVWTRLLALVFGVTLYALSAVLSSFMAGLALGSFAAGQLADRVRRPLLWYACAELAIGVAGAGSLAAIGALTPLYQWLSSVSGDSFALVTSIRFVAAFLLLLIPTSLMGATLPLIFKASLLLLPKVGENVSLIYAMNTAGAALGTLAAGFVFIGDLGLQGTVTLAAVCNLIVGVLALALDRIAQSAATEEASEAETFAAASSPAARPSLLNAAIIFSMGVSGFCALAYEVIWFRILDLFLNGTVYAFSIMLVTFLVGLALGSALTRPFIGKRWPWAGVLGVLEFLVAVECIFAIYMVSKAPLVRDLLSSMAGETPWLGTPVALMIVVSVLLLLPLTILLGMTFPVAAQALAEGRRHGGALIGQLNASNTVGAILGSLAAGFWLAPWLGSQHSLILLAAVNVAVAILLLWLAAERRPRLRLALPFAALIVGAPLAAPDLTVAVLRGLFKDHQLLWHEEGLENTVSVFKHPQGFTTMYINSREQAFDLPGMASFHHFIGHLPMLLHPAPREVLVIGLGGGATPGAVSLYENAHIDIVELSPSVVRAAAYFTGINYSVMTKPNVRMIVDDGRNHLLLTHKRYDVITADLIRPHHAGAGNLYSREYYTLAMNALRDDGMMTQWVDVEQPWISTLIMRTFVNVFPYVTFWDEGALMVGSKRPLDLTPETLQRRLSQPEALPGAQVVGAFAVDVLRHYSGDA